MRKLVILRGSMGAGKSTWIKENGLEEYTLCADTMRLHLTSPRMGIKGKDGITQTSNKQAWDMLFYFLEERMKNGEFTIIDAVHSKSSEFTRYKQLAEQYRYRMYCVDFTDIPIETAKERNAQRPEFKQVPEPEIDKVYSRFKTQEVPNQIKTVKPEEFNTILTEEPFDWNDYSKIHIFGDIHGCYSVLKKYFDEYPFSEDEGYIFIGDYFDRGIENVETFNFLAELITKPNTLFLTGNHEEHLRNYAFGMPIKSREFLNKTAVQFAKAGIETTDIRQFYRKLGAAAYITFRDMDFIISHGGIPYFPNKSMDFYAAASFIKGVGNYEDDIDEIFDNWAQKENKKRLHPIYQIHGHRNIFKYPLVYKEYSYNLEGEVEFGGNLRVLQITSDGAFNPKEIKNDIFSQELVDERNNSADGIVHSAIHPQSVGMFIQELRKCKFIQEKMLDSGVSSFNFTRNAFEKGIWNNVTTQARGLFIDIKNEKIQARSYNKFFNKNEREETRMGYLAQNLKFPVHFYKKYNGFLGLLSLRNGELFFCSKSSDYGDHVEYFKNIFYRIYGNKQIEAIKDRLEKENITMVFEVIDPINDPHIIKYNNQDLILLDMIYNKINFKRVPYKHLVAFGEKAEIKVKELIYTANNFQEFLAINSEIEAEDYKCDGEYIEGFVVEDSEDFMFKYKLHYYNTWKSLRWVLNRYMSNPTSVNTFSNTLTLPVENYFLGYLRQKFPNGNKSGDYEIITDIISERDGFIKNGGQEI